MPHVRCWVGLALGLILGDRLIQEVAELQDHLGRLHAKLAEAEEALKMLTNTKRELKEDLTVKAVSLVIDRQKCMAMRLSFPYHTRHLAILQILKST